MLALARLSAFSLHVGFQLRPGPRCGTQISVPPVNEFLKTPPRQLVVCLWWVSSAVVKPSLYYRSSLLISLCVLSRSRYIPVEWKRIVLFEGNTILSAECEQNTPGSVTACKSCEGEQPGCFATNNHRSCHALPSPLWSAAAAARQPLSFCLRWSEV